MCLLGAVHPYEQLRQDEDGAPDNRSRWETVLFAVLGFGVVAFVALEVASAQDTPVVGGCYSSGGPLPDGDTVLRVKHLCRADDIAAKGWTSFAFVNYTCRGVSGVEKWGVVEEVAPSGKPGAVPAPAPAQPEAAGGRKLASQMPRRLAGSQRQPSEEPHDQVAAVQHAAPEAGPRHPAGPQPGPAQKGEPQRQLQEQWSKEDHVREMMRRLKQQRRRAIGPSQRPEFCAQVGHNSEGALRRFIPQQTAEGCSGIDCGKDVDKKMLYNFVGDLSSTWYYALSGDQQPKGLTCCGMRYTSPVDNALAWLAGLAGCMSLIWGALTMRPQQGRPKAITE